LIKNYHSGKELLTAFKTLDDHYGRSDMVIRECIRNIRQLEPIRNEYSTKANKTLLSAIKTNISTLNCYNFDIEGNQVENSTFLITIEEKIPYQTYIKWQ
jgi:hypothetical protein